MRFGAEGQARRDVRHRRHVRAVHRVRAVPCAADLVRGVNGELRVATHRAFQAQATGARQQIVGRLPGNEALARADEQRAADQAAWLALYAPARRIGIVADPCAGSKRDHAARGKGVMAHLTVYGDAPAGRDHVAGDLAVDDHGLAPRDQVTIDRAIHGHSGAAHEEIIIDDLILADHDVLAAAAVVRRCRRDEDEQGQDEQGQQGEDTSFAIHFDLRVV